MEKLLKADGITSALPDIGGNIQAVGSRPDGSGWRIGLRNPFGEGQIYITEGIESSFVLNSRFANMELHVIKASADE